MIKINHLVNQFELEPHPEGGFFKEVYRSHEKISKACLNADYSGDRNYATSIYFLLTSGNFSAFHKIKQDELWHHYEGAAIIIHVIDEEGNYTKQPVGKDYSRGEVPQFVVRGGCWFASEVLEEDAYAFVGCTVAPGFDFEDFEMPSREWLISKYPSHAEIITSLTRI